MINKIEFSAKNLTSHAGLFLLLEQTNRNEVFDQIDRDLVFDSASTNKIKLNQYGGNDTKIVAENLRRGISDILISYLWEKFGML